MGAKKKVGTVPTLVVLKEFFVGGGVVCRAVSGSYANTAIATSKWPFLPNCLIVLVGQAGGSKPHLASSEKKNMHINTGYGSMGVLGEGGSIRHFSFSKLHIPPWQISKVLAWIKSKFVPLLCLMCFAE